MRTALLLLLAGCSLGPDLPHPVASEDTAEGTDTADTADTSDTAADTGADTADTSASTP